MSAAGQAASAEGGGQQFCTECGAPNALENRFCTQCGTKLALQEGPSPDPPEEDDEVAQTQRLEAPPDWEKVKITHLLPSSPETHPFTHRMLIGRDGGDLQIPEDPYLSTKHLVIRREEGECLLEDLESRNGTFVKIRKPVPVGDGDELMMGSQILRYRDRAEGEATGAQDRPGLAPTKPLGGTPLGRAVLERVIEGGKVGEVFPLSSDRTVIGREEGDICLSDDPLLSEVHASLELVDDEEGRGVHHVVKDEGSRNGVFLRLRKPWTLKKGDVFTAGRQVFRFEGGEDQ